MSSLASPRRRLCIIGGGPVGIETALAFANGGAYHVTLLERGNTFASNVSNWGHVRLFSPWAYNMSTLGRTVLPTVPDESVFPTGAELRSQYLAHLWEHLNKHAHVELRLNTTVIGLTRGTALKGDMAHRRGPFRVLSVTPNHDECLDEFDAVVDASGTYGNANRLGMGGLPALGERAMRQDPSVVYSLIPNVAAQICKYGHGRTTCVIGTGHSAITTINALRKLASNKEATTKEEEKEKTSSAVRLLWATRRMDNLYKNIPNDPLPQRVELNALGNALCGAKEGSMAAEKGFEGFDAVHLGGVQLGAMRRVTTAAGVSRIELTFQPLHEGKEVQTVVVDEVVANVGFRPDMAMARELQIHHCYATEGPMKLAAQLMAQGGGGGDCLAQTSGGAASLVCPEKDFLVLGMKSYGRSSTFLLKIGNEQVAHAMELLEGGAR